jgi:hypothetical protein
MTTMAATQNYLAAFYGQKAVERIEWIAAGDYRNALVRDLFPHWQAAAVAYAMAAARAARGEY